MGKPTRELADGFHLLRLVHAFCGKFAVRYIDNLHHQLFNFGILVFYDGNTGGAMGHAAGCRVKTQFLLQAWNFTKQKLPHAIQELAAIIAVQCFIKGEICFLGIPASNEVMKSGIGKFNLPRRRHQNQAMAGRRKSCAEALVTACRGDLGNLVVRYVLQHADGALDASLVAAIGIHRQHNGCQCAILAVHKHFLVAAKTGLQIFGVDIGDEMRTRLRGQQFIECAANYVTWHIAQRPAPLPVHRIQAARTVHRMHHDGKVEQHLFVNTAVFLIGEKRCKDIGRHIFLDDFP